MESGDLSPLGKARALSHAFETGICWKLGLQTSIDRRQGWVELIVLSRWVTGRDIRFA
jgi:hypothetical protein